jgi:putative flippase GtrA
MSKTKRAFSEVIKYVIIGGLGAVFNLILLYLFTAYIFGSEFWFVPGYIASAGVTTIIIFAWNFIGYKWWAFSDKPTKHPFSVIERFARRLFTR